MHKEDMQFYSRQIENDVQLKSAIDTHEAVEAEMNLHNVRTVDFSVMGLIAVLVKSGVIAAKVEPDESKFVVGSMVVHREQGVGKFVCYWRGKARVSFPQDDKKFRVVELSELENV